MHAAWKNLDFNYSFIYVGERYHNSTNILANHEEPWYTHDLSASYLFNVKKTTLKITAEVNNIFNQRYAASGWVYSAICASGGHPNDNRYYQIGFIPMAGFTVMGNLTLRF